MRTRPGTNLEAPHRRSRGRIRRSLLRRHTWPANCHSDDFEITVVNAEPDFVERLRLHQLAAGQDLRHRPLAEVFAGTGIRLRLAQVTAVDVEHRTVTVTDGEGMNRLEYDTLLYALGSTADGHGVPGVDEHAFHVAARPSALRLRAAPG